MRYFVHVYHVVRAKFLVEADSDQDAIKAADAALPEAARRMQYSRLASVEEEGKMAPLFDAADLPIHLQTEGDDGEPPQFYLIDEVGDEEYERSRWFDGAGHPLDLQTQKTIHVTTAESDTILAALRFWQDFREGHPSDEPMLKDIATGGDQHPMLGFGEIDALCERINR